ncbi:MAG: hypothetical protein JOZ69_03910, partial [Myxococcales bacterium]|nr:hypothetical protein [Myxococcales bacterium]
TLFRSRPARCHAVSLARRDDPGAFGFVCGEPHGRTAVYRWDAAAAMPVELRRFTDPREVLSFANGAVAARGPCDDSGDEEPEPSAPRWCVMSPRGTWREARVGVGERVAVLADGRVLGIRPPGPGGDLATAALVVHDRDEEGAVRPDAARALAFPTLPADVARALSSGVWMNGFEERRPGVVGGWIDAAGALLGVEIASSGEVRVGEYIRDAGAPVASGRWAFGWTASRRGFETTDGGMTWKKEIALPDPIASGRDIHERACGPVGCIAAGWFRIGWGGAGQPVAEDPPPFSRPSPPRHPPRLDLECDPVAAPPPGANAPSPPGTGARTGSSPGEERSATSAGSGAPSRADAPSFPAFGSQAPPSVPPDHLGFTVEASNGLERTLRIIPLAQVYAWGPKAGDWDQLGRWQVRWQWPWGGGADLRSSSPGASPWPTADGARRALSRGQAGGNVWALAEGDDADHALLLARHTAAPATAEVAVLEADRPPMFVARSDGEPFADVEGAVRAGGRWYVATAQTAGELAATVLWVIDGPLARELARLPRGGFESRPSLRLARHTGGKGIGVVVDGQPDPLTGVTERWVTAVDVTSGAVAAPRPLAPTELSDRPVTACAGDSEGWVVDSPYPAAVRARFGARRAERTEPEVPLHSVVVRLKISDERACVDGVVGVLDGDTPSPDIAASSLFDRAARARIAVAAVAPAAVALARTIDASVLVGKVRLGWRCGAR